MDDVRRPSAIEHRLTVAADVAAIAALRQQVTELARAGGAGHTVADDLVLVVSELATNVAQHTSADEISVLLRRTDDRWTVEVDDADGIEALDDASLPAPDALSGRGLYIVQAVMDEVDLVDDGEHRRLRCSKLVG